jgi:6-phosphogluconolactonase
VLTKSWDARRDLVVPGDDAATLKVAVEHLVTASKEAIANHGAFFIALSGGSTPKAIFQRLCLLQLDWGKWHVFWSDERAVPPDHPDSNYRMAMEAGFNQVAIPPHQIHRMHAEDEIEKNAALYEKTIRDVLKGRGFDFMMLGMGDDGHTASLFPHTAALKVVGKLAVANFVPQHNTWRMTLTYECINQSKHIVFYVLGAKKKEMLHHVLTSQSEEFPAEKVGTIEHKALWIADSAAFPV